MKTMFPELRERDRQLAAYRRAVTRYAVFDWDATNRYPRSAARSKLYRSAMVAERAAKRIGLQCVVRTVTLTDAEAGVTRPE